MTLRVSLLLVWGRCVLRPYIVPPILMWLSNPEEIDCCNWAADFLSFTSVCEAFTPSLLINGSFLNFAAYSFNSETDKMVLPNRFFLFLFGSSLEFLTTGLPNAPIPSSSPSDPSSILRARFLTSSSITMPSESSYSVTLRSYSPQFSPSESELLDPHIFLSFHLW